MRLSEEVREIIWEESPGLTLAAILVLALLDRGIRFLVAPPYHESRRNNGH